MDDLNSAFDYENPSIQTLKELYSNQNRECWLCKEIANKIEVGKELKEEEIWHFTNCVMAWEEINHEPSVVNQPLEKAA